MSEEAYQKLQEYIKTLTPEMGRQIMIDSEIIDEEGIYTKHYPHLRAAQLADLEEVA